MTQQQWIDVDRYITDLFVPPDPALDEALAASAEAGLPAHNVSPNQGKLLLLLAEIQGARTILEIGTLGGYSTIWLARSLPSDGRLITLEADPKHAQVAITNIARAGLADIVELRLGRALDTLPQLDAEGYGSLHFQGNERRSDVPITSLIKKLLNRTPCKCIFNFSAILPSNIRDIVIFRHHFLKSKGCS